MARDGRREKGSGSIFKRGKKHIAQVQEGFTEEGRPKYRQVSCRTQADAVRALNELNALIATGRAIPDRRGYTVSAWLDAWLEDHVKVNRETKTYQFYRLMSESRIKPYLGRMELQRVSPTDVTRLFRAIEADGATPNTINAVRRTLRAAYGVAMKYGHAHDNPVSKTFAPKIRRTQKVYFDADQVQKLLKALVGSPIENLVKFTLATGMRVGEVTGLTWDIVDLKQKSVFVTSQLQRIGSELVLKPLKTEKSTRTMPLVGHSLEVIRAEQVRQEDEAYDNELNLVFLNPLGRPFDPKYVNDHLHQALESAGLPRTGMHSLRHSAATFMLMAGLNLHQVSRYLGHSQIALTSNLYGHVLDGAMRDAAKKLQLAYSEQKLEDMVEPNDWKSEVRTQTDD
ncbi:MAG: tyrosine-type recombinase/integrase [Fimbriimonas sp.]